MIELCLVMTLLVVLFTAAWPSFESLHEHFQRERLVEDLADCMAFARMGAVAERCLYEIRFSRNPTAYQLFREDHPADGRWAKVKPVADPLDLETPQEPVVFFPNGSSSAAKIVVMENHNPVMTLELGGSLGLVRIAEGEPS